MGINAVKGVEIGAGFLPVKTSWFDCDQATSSIRLPRRTIDADGDAATIETHGRYDPCVGIRATPTAEAFLALVLIDHAIRHRAQNGDVKEGAAATPVSSRDSRGKRQGQRLEDLGPLEAVEARCSRLGRRTRQSPRESVMATPSVKVAYEDGRSISHAVANFCTLPATACACRIHRASSRAELSTGARFQF